MSSVGKREKQLTIEFRFAYPNAREAYGVIEKNSLITLKLFDGQIIELKAGELDLGKYETEKDILTYYIIPVGSYYRYLDELKKLLTNPEINNY